MMPWKMLFAVAVLGLSSPQVWSAAPEAELTNGVMRMRVYLPDAKEGFYRGTRFDWSGVIADLSYKGHRYYGPWFSKTDPGVRDFIYSGPDIVAGPCSAITGPAEEFNPALGFEEAGPGGTFMKIGVGVLRKPDNEKYGSFRPYEVVDGGIRSFRKGRNFLEFSQELRDPSTGYGYVYTKTLRLVAGKPDLVIEHTLRNIGSRRIDGNTYNHNFLVLDHESPGPAFSISFPFKVGIDDVPKHDLVRTEQDNRIAYLAPLVGEDRVYASLNGFSNSPAGLKIRIENTKLKTGMTISGDRPFSKMALWSIRSVLAVEPFVNFSIDPGGEFKWSYHYEYYTY